MRASRRVGDCDLPAFVATVGLGSVMSGGGCQRLALVQHLQVGNLLSHRFIVTGNQRKYCRSALSAYRDLSDGADQLLDAGF